MKNFNEILTIDIENLQMDGCAEETVSTMISKNEIEGVFANFDGYILFFLESNKDIVCKQLEKITGDNKVTDHVRPLREITDCWFQQDDIEMNTDYGKIYLSDNTIDTIMIDEMLNNQEVIDKLVNAEDFMNELTEVRKESIRIAFDLTYDIAKTEYLEKEIAHYYK